MVSSTYAVLLGAVCLVAAQPFAEKRVVTALNQAAFEEAHQRDNTATRAFSSISIKTSGGKCLFVDELSGDFRANLTPIQVGECDGSAAVLWDIITAGKHNNQPGNALIVSTLTQACFNFDPRRAAGNQVLLFSCGGRADGSGAVTNSQLFPFTGGAGPLSFTPGNAVGTCLTVKGAVLDQAPCNAADPNQSFTFGDASPTAPASPTASSTVPAPPADPNRDCPAAVTVTVSSVSTVTVSSVSTVIVSSGPIATVSSRPQTVTSISQPPAVTTRPVSSANVPSSVISVSRAGGVLNPSAVAEAHQRDNTAARAFSSVSIKSSSGLCLFVDRTAGDFRENLIPIILQPCQDITNQKWDIITSGIHNNQPNSALLVSALTQGCVNFDDRRAAGDTVMLFSCGGRADGGGQVTDSQLFAFSQGQTSLRLLPNNARGSICLVANAQGRLDQAPCSNDPSQVFTIA